MKTSALVVVLAYTAVRVGEPLRNCDDPRRGGIRWEDINLSSLESEIILQALEPVAIQHTDENV